ncbi:MAG: GTP-dependent nucleic acid-binding protein EngD [Parcubacteria group bacterium Gr01-1014_56]|nr:MAG: GTP-dependent nucleic acid-binding protein EngD [Parcubacteria group bacterium Gr01-1014_56]
MQLSVGIVGLPNVGKSTLFQALTKKSVLIANYPFATIDPSVGVVAVPDTRREKLAAFSQSKKDIPAAIEFVDIAGLVRGASEGEGLGNQFLSHIREVSAIAHVVRIFENTNIAQVNDTIDPLRDIELINTELQLADIETKDKTRLLAGKPVLYVLNKESGGHNLDETPSDERWVRLVEYFKQHNATYVVVDANVENDLRDLHTEDKVAFRQELGVDDGINGLIRASYALLGLMSFFTTGKDETRAWTIERGSTAPQAGAAIHTDFKDKFIRAEVIMWDKLLEAGSWAKARELGLIRTEGKEYIVKDGDTIEFLHG